MSEQIGGFLTVTVVGAVDTVVSGLPGDFLAVVLIVAKGFGTMACYQIGGMLFKKLEQKFNRKK